MNKEKFIKELNGITAYANHCEPKDLDFVTIVMIENLLRKLLFPERFDNKLEPKPENELDEVLSDLDYLVTRAAGTAYLPAQGDYITRRAKNIQETLCKNNENLVNTIGEKVYKIQQLEERLYYIEKVAANILAETKDEEIKNECKSIFGLCDLKTKFMVDDANNFIFYEKEDLLK